VSNTTEGLIEGQVHIVDVCHWCTWFQ